MPEEAREIGLKNEKTPRMEYVLLILEMCVFNLKTDVSSAIRKMSKMAADEALTSLYNGCIMLNPALDVATWLELTVSHNTFVKDETKQLTEGKESIKNTAEKKPTQKKKTNSIPHSKLINIERYLSEKIIGQQESIKKLSSAMKRAQVGLNDPNRPLGVFLFCGPSGVGKTRLAKELHSYMFDTHEIIRIDCGEFQHKHENQKITGSPPGYIGHDEASQLVKQITKHPDTVVLLDEAEKAHPDFWHTFLKVFDDGYITDNKGNNVSFKNAIVVITSNIGNDKVSKITFEKSAGFTSNINDSYDSKNTPKRELVERITNEEIRKFFKPEFINRLDDIIIFNYLNHDDLLKIAELEMLYLADKLYKQQINIVWNSDTLELLVKLSSKTMEGARGMSKVRRDMIETQLADLLLNNKYAKGTIFNITTEKDNFILN
jgi:ATP-dependent Clp protease ATP-binding subunit ClpC